MNLGPEDNYSGKELPLAAEPEQDAAMDAALRHALRPELAPAGFTERLMARLDAEEGAEEGIAAGVVPTASRQPAAAPSGKVLHWPQSRLWVTGAVAAALAVGVLEGGLALERMRAVQQQERRVREATQQFQTSERITVHALAQAREQLQRAGVPLSFE